MTGEDFGCAIGCWIVIIAIGVVVAFYLRSQAEAARRRREEEERYRASLSEAETNYRRMLEILRSNPTDPNMRERALSWGRRFAELTRQPVGLGVTIYDEVALLNDFNAACAGANNTNQSATIKEPGAAIAIEERLARLKDLLDKGLISAEEYSEKRLRLLDEA